MADYKKIVSIMKSRTTGLSSQGFSTQETGCDLGTSYNEFLKKEEKIVLLPEKNDFVKNITTPTAKPITGMPSRIQSVITATTDVVISEKSKLELLSVELSGTARSRISTMRIVKGAYIFLI